MWIDLDRSAGLYAAERNSGAGWHWRATALSLPDGGSLVVGPLVDLGDDAHRSLIVQAGVPRVVLAPNHFHYLALPEYRKLYPKLEIVASEVASGRIVDKLEIQPGPLDIARDLLPPHASLLEPPGLANGEVWLRLEGDAGVTWIVSDAFFNLIENARGFIGLLLRVTGTAPGLRIGRTFTWLGVDRKAEYREWLLAQIDADLPRRLIPGHGAVIEDDDLPDRLRELVGRRLG